MTDPNPALRQFAVSVTPGVVAPRAAGFVGSIPLPPVSGDDRRLLGAVRGQATRIELEHRQNLAPPPTALSNRLLLIDALDPELGEYHTVASIEPVGLPQERARIVLDLPLDRDHRAGAIVSRINAPAVLPPTPRVLRDAAEPGDRCVFLDGLGTLGASGTLRLAGGGVADEFHAFRRLTTQSDGDGYYRLPPIQRIAKIELTADDGLGNVKTIEFDPTYDEHTNRLDIVYVV